MRLSGRSASRFCIALSIVSAMVSSTPGYAHNGPVSVAPLHSAARLASTASAVDPVAVESFAAVAAECVGDEAKYWRIRNLLLARAGLWSSGESTESFTMLAADAGLEPSAFVKCFESRRALQRSLAHRDEVAAPAWTELAAAPPPLRT